MHNGTNVMGGLLLILGLILLLMGITDAGGPTLRMYGSIITGTGISFLILSKVIGVLEEIRDRLPEPDKPKEKKKPGRKVNRRSTIQ